MRKRVEVRRAGNQFGIFEAEDFDALQEQGEFLPTDLCREEGSEEWTALESFLKRRKISSYKAALFSSDPSDASKTTSEGASFAKEAGKRPVKSPVWGVFSVVLFLVLVSGLGSLAFWQALELRSWKSRAAELQAEVKKLRSMAPPPNPEPDLVPRGVIRGRMILKNLMGKRVAIPGVHVRLFPRAELEKYFASEIPNVLNSHSKNPLAALLANLPNPLETTTTDASGIYSFQPPEVGDYVVQTSIYDKKVGTFNAWFLAVDTRDPLNTPINITEANASSVINPLLILQQAR